MARTKSLALFYSITQTEVIPPPAKELERKEAWLKAWQSTVEAPYKPLTIRVTYEYFDPEVQNMVKFFNGACVAYWLIQQTDMTDREPTSVELKQAREDVLDEMLGYDYQTTRRIVHKRESTADFKTVQRWYTFLKTLEETMFEPNGYEMPDSEVFWALVKQHGYEQAKSIAIKKLQDILKRKHV